LGRHRHWITIRIPHYLRGPKTRHLGRRPHRFRTRGRPIQRNGSVALLLYTPIVRRHGPPDMGILKFAERIALVRAACQPHSGGTVSRGSLPTYLACQIARLTSFLSDHPSPGSRIRQDSGGNKDLPEFWRIRLRVLANSATPALRRAPTGPSRAAHNRPPALSQHGGPALRLSHPTALPLLAWELPSGPSSPTGGQQASTHCCAAHTPIAES